MKKKSITINKLERIIFLQSIIEAIIYKHNSFFSLELCLKIQNNNNFLPLHDSLYFISFFYLAISKPVYCHMQIKIVNILNYISSTESKSELSELNLIGIFFCI